METLILDGAPVRDLGVLAGMPIKVLSLTGCGEARRFEALSALSALEVLILPQNFFELPEEIGDIRALRSHGSLKQIDTRSLEGAKATSAGSAELFWREWEADLVWLEKLQAIGVKPILVKLSDHTWELELRNQPLRDLACLAGASLSRLGLFNVPISDLRPLANMPLRYLDLRLTQVSDLSPLSGMPLQQLFLWRTKVSDFSPVATLLELELLDAPETELSDLRVIQSRKLRELRIGNTKVADLGPLAGLPLERLHCDHIPATDIRPLLQCARLKWLIPPGAGCDLGPLRQLASLERISHEWGDESEPTMTAKAFWEQYDRAAAAAAK